MSRPLGKSILVVAGMAMAATIGAAKLVPLTRL